MKAVVLRPGQPDSVACTDVPEPTVARGQALLETIEVGVCGTDREILAGAHGAAPAGSPTLIPGHECLARVLSAPDGSGLAPGQLVAPTVRRPCGRPECYPCAHDHPDMCITLAYTERGIQGQSGYQCQRFAEDPRYLVPLPAALRPAAVLTEPTSVVAKAVAEAERVQQARLAWRPRRALVTGAGPVGLLGAMLLRLRGLDVAVYDRLAADSPKARAATALGARYICAAEAPLGTLAQGDGFDWMLECTGAPALVFGVLPALRPAGVLCLLGVSGGGAKLEIPAADINLRLVLTNALIFGSVNASAQAFSQATSALAAAETTWPGWAGSLITRHVQPEAIREAVQPGPADIKVVVDWAA